jgi:hypothetical protein
MNESIYEISNEAIAFCSVLSTMRCFGDRWTGAHTQAYGLGIARIPPEDFIPLSSAVLAAFDERPSVKQILDLHRKIVQPQDDHRLATVRAELHRLVKRYGPHGSPHTKFPHRANIRELGPPPEFFELPEAVQIVVDAYGGWVAFAQNFDFNDSTDTAQFRDLYEAVDESASESAVKRIAMEYRAMKPRDNAEISRHAPRTAVLVEKLRSDTFDTFESLAKAISAREEKR